ncbi:MAG: ABC transporter permease, partial [Microgenomates group bacterium]
QSQIQSLGSNLLTISPGATTSSGVRQAAGSSNTLILDDALAIKTKFLNNYITDVSPELSRRAQVTYERNNTNTQIVGVYPGYQTLRNINLSEGDFISQFDVDGIRQVAVLGPQVVSDLFGDGVSPVGKTIRITGKSFRVIGVTTSKGGTGFFNQDDIIFVPLSTAQKILFGVDYLSSIAIGIKDEKLMNQARDEIGYFLLARHKINNPYQADFTIMSQADILQTATSVTSTFTNLLSGIAAISLLVGGIGIMNIMLVSVIERTREIGLRKALGAKNKIVVLQFLTESIILTLIGGIIGIISGVIIYFVLAKLMNFSFVLSWWGILLSFIFSSIVGVVFGFYPAKKASELSPIEALRYE